MTESLVSCAVGADEYALRAPDIVAVMRADRMRAPAACEAGVGIVTVGGERASVYPLGTTIGISSAPDDGTVARPRHVVVLRGPQGLTGWLVDRVARSRLPARTRVLPLPALVGPQARRWFAGVLSTGERTLLLLASSMTATPPHQPAAPMAPVRPGALTTSGSRAAAPVVVTFTSAALPDCGASRYAISTRRVCGVESNLDVAVIPGSDAPVIGVGVLHDEVVPVIDLRGPAAPLVRVRRRLLIIRGGGRLADTPVAIPIDAETALCQSTDDHPLVEPAAGGDLPPFVAGLFDVRGHTVALIDPDRLLDADLSAHLAGAPSNDVPRTAAGRMSSAWTDADRRTIA